MRRNARPGFCGARITEAALDRLDAGEKMETETHTHLRCNRQLVENMKVRVSST